MDRIVNVFVIVTLIAAWCGASEPASQSSIQPYSIYVTAENAYVRSGPSQEYYRTDPITFGEELEVYLETSDGWLGVRPPESSFSWLPATQVELAEDQTTARVVAPRTVAWIGTNLGKAKKFRWQVQLAEGEEVVILDRTTRTDADGEKQVWLRIVPPSGEFRWLHRKNVVRTKEGLERRMAERESERRARLARNLQSDLGQAQPQRGDRSGAIVQASNQIDDPAPKPRQRQQDVVPAAGADADNPLRTASRQPHPAPIGSGVAQADYEADRDEPADDGWADSLAGPPNRPPADRSNGQGGEDANGNTVAEGEPARTSVANAQPSFDALPIEALQVRFSKAVADEAAADELNDLAEHVRYLSDAGDDKLVRARATILLERIERYQSIADERVASQAAADANKTDIQSTTRSAFDREGYLVQVYSARPNAPPFALTNRSGETIAYVSPTPGINLRRYLNEKIGVRGRTGYLTGLDTPHLIAERVARLSQ